MLVVVQDPTSCGLLDDVIEHGVHPVSLTSVEVRIDRRVRNKQMIETLSSELEAEFLHEDRDFGHLGKLGESAFVQFLGVESV